MESAEVMGLDAVRVAHPWPEKRPFPGLVGLGYGFDGGGRELVDALIRQKGRATMLEVGVAFGSSARRWLAQSPQLIVRKATWVISDEPPSLRNRLDLMERWFADVSRPLRRWLKR